MSTIRKPHLNKRDLLIVTEALRSTNKVALSFAAKAANAWVTTIQLKNNNGENLAVATMVAVKTYAPTAAKGVITTTTGTEKTNEAVTTKTHVASILSDATGLVVISIADDQAEKVTVEVMADGCMAAVALTP